jgi:3-keto-5-aminohexanoate cleavage enzyme
MEKLIITAAITGSRITRDDAPHIPVTPDEIVQSSIECWNAGAAIVHIHVRDPKTGLGTQDLDLFRQVVEPLREKTDLVLCLTTSGIPGRNLPIEERLISLELDPELASFDAGSINLGGSVFINPPEFLEAAAKRMKEKGVKPELEIFDVGMIVTCLRMRNSVGKPRHPEILPPPVRIYSPKFHVVYHRGWKGTSPHVHDGPDHGRAYPSGHGG